MVAGIGNTFRFPNLPPGGSLKQRRDSPAFNKQHSTVTEQTAKQCDRYAWLDASKARWFR